VLFSDRKKMARGFSARSRQRITLKWETPESIVR